MLEDRSVRLAIDEFLIASDLRDLFRGRVSATEDGHGMFVATRVYMFLVILGGDGKSVSPSTFDPGRLVVLCVIDHGSVDIEYDAEIRWRWVGHRKPGSCPKVGPKSSAPLREERFAEA